MSTESHETRDRQYETNFHDSHVRPRPYEDLIGYANLSWLATRSKDLRSIVDVERIRDENGDAYAALMRSTADYTKVRILRLAVAYGTVTYADLDSATPDVSERTVKSKVAELRDEGVLDVGEGRPAAIGFVDEDVALLASDVLAYLD